MNFVFFLLIPVGISLGAFLTLRATITFKEFLLQLSLGVGIVAISWSVSKQLAISDTQLLNGRITYKEHGTQACCHCKTVCESRNSEGTCTESVKKCDHSKDYYWKLQTSVGTLDVKRCSGSSDPPNGWVFAFVGEPAAVSASYTNYLKADPESLFRYKDFGHFTGLPEYPTIHDLYKVDHVVGTGVQVPEGWQTAIREINADLGAPKQVDVTIVLTRTKDPTFAQALEAKWIYGPKNAVTIVIGVDNQRIAWVRVVTFSHAEDLKVHLRDNLQGLELNDPTVISLIRQGISQEFHRTPMKEFAYLASAAEPKGWALILIAIIQLVASVFLTIWVHKEDVFKE